MRTATSTDSPPVERNIARSSGGGSVAISASARSSTGGESIQEFRWMTSSSECRMASVTRGWLWPTVAQIWPAVKSSTRLPPAVSSQEPRARTTRSSAKAPP
jgi:hypothetical protein